MGNTAEFGVRISGDSRGGVNAISLTSTELKKLKTQVQDYSKGAKGATKNNSALANSLRSAANSSSILYGPLNGISGRFAALSAGINLFNPAVVAAGVGLSAITATLAAAVKEAGQFEVQFGRLEALVKSTGASAGLSAREISDFADEVGRNTLASAAGIRDAAGVVLTFRSISKPVFKETITLAQDMSAVMGTDAKQAALQLAKALEEPTTGLTALRRSGVSFTEAEREKIRVLVESGAQLEAQRAILQKVREQVGGAGEAEGQGLVGAIDLLTENWSRFLRVVGETSGLKASSTGFFNDMAVGLGLITDALDESAIEKQKRLFQELIELQFSQPDGDSARDDVQRQRIQRNIAAKKSELAEVTKIVRSQQAEEFSIYQQGIESQKKLVEEAANDRQKKIEEQNRKLQGDLAKAARSNLESVEGFLRTEEQALTFSYANRQQVINEAFQRGIVDQERHNELALSLAEKHQSDLDAIRSKASEKGGRDLSDVARGLLTEEELVISSYRRRKEIILANTQEASEAQTELLLRLEEEKTERLLEINGSYWERWLTSAEENLANFDELSASVIDRFSQGFGDAFEKMIADGGSFGDAMRGVVESLLRTTINALGQMAAQWLAYQLVQKVAQKGAQSGVVSVMGANAEAMSIAAGLNAFQATAAIPYIGPILAPGAAASAVLATSPMVAGVIAAASSGLTSFEGGGFTGFGPRSGGIDGRGGFPAILHRNEVVTDLTKGKFVGQPAGVSIGSISLPGVTNRREAGEAAGEIGRRVAREYKRAQRYL